jgi:hypothetical protein
VLAGHALGDRAGLGRTVVLDKNCATCAREPSVEPIADQLVARQPNAAAITKDNVRYGAPARYQGARS